MGKVNAFRKGFKVGKAGQRASKGKSRPGELKQASAQLDLSEPKATSAGIVAGVHRHKIVGASAGLIGAGAYIHAQRQPIKPGNRAQNKHPLARSSPGMDDSANSVV